MIDFASKVCYTLKYGGVFICLVKRILLEIR